MRSDHDRVRLCMVLGGHWAAQMGGAQFQAKCILDVLAEDARFETSYLARVVPAQRDWDSYRIVSFGEGLPGRAIGTLLQLPSLYLALRRQRPQVVYQRCLMPYTGMCALYCAINGARFVFHVASDGDVHREPLTRWSPGGLLRALSRRISEFGMRHADAIVVQTEHQARILKAQYGLTATIVVPNFHPAAAHRSEVGLPGLLERPDLAQHEDVADPRHGGGHHVEGAAGHQPARDAVHPRRLEVVQQGVVGREGAGADPAEPGLGIGRRQGDLVVGERWLAVHGRQAGLALDLDDRGRQAVVGGGPGQGGRDGGFAHPALARNDDEAGCSEELRWIHS